MHLKYCPVSNPTLFLTHIRICSTCVKLENESVPWTMGTKMEQVFLLTYRKRAVSLGIYIFSYAETVLLKSTADPGDYLLDLSLSAWNNFKSQLKVVVTSFRLTVTPIED
jgi:hypothetical protein